MKRACEQFRKGNVNNLSPTLQALITSPIDPAFATIADAFVELQEARHTADYDVLDNFTKADVLAKIALVDQAFLGWRRVRGTPNANVFLAALLLQRQWRSFS
jgi:hypothetical protein